MISKMTHAGRKFALRYDGYQAGGLAISLWANGERWHKATVWVPGLAPGEVAVKDYNENEGMLESLLAAEVVHPPYRHVRSGFVMIPICKLTQEALDGVPFRLFTKES